MLKMIVVVLVALLVAVALVVVAGAQTPDAFAACRDAAKAAGTPESACYRLRTDSIIAAGTGAPISVLTLVEECVTKGDSAEPACVALEAFASQTPPPPTGRAEGPVSPTFTFLRPLLKWNQAAPSLDELQQYQWILHVGTERRDLTGVTCGLPSGQTPLDQFSCSLELPDVPTGSELAVSSWRPVPTLSAATGLRLVLR